MNTLYENYCVGPLLYCPANQETFVESLSREKFGTHYSLALCLEDTIDDNHVEDAEEKLISSLLELSQMKHHHSFYMPQIFIRVRNARQMTSLYSRLGQAQSLLTGFIAPKFDPANADSYIERILEINKQSSSLVSIMPILESTTLIHLQHRYELLYAIRDKLDSIKEYVRNVRVGGNDLCHAFGFRRGTTQSIYDIRPIAAILSDIVTVFGTEYVLSGPVWEYYNGADWDSGLLGELKLDRLNGFVGKTVIHPQQIALVNQAYQVSRSDYEDALSILGWDCDSPTLVSASNNKSRMNEYKTHHNWANKIILLAKAYGIADQ